MKGFWRIFGAIVLTSTVSVLTLAQQPGAKSSGRHRMVRDVKAAEAGPCTAATSSCTEWVMLAGGPARSLIYRTRSEKITRALIMVHGQGRDIENYFRTAVAAAFLANALDDTIGVSATVGAPEPLP
jgi:hypothetical protein